MPDPAIDICLVTPGHVASTPRLVKNADALAAAGYRVHVVAGRNFPPVDPLDAEIFSRARWTWTIVDRGSRSQALVERLSRRAARARLRLIGGGVAAASLGLRAPVYRLMEAAKRVRARFYFGHGLPGLPAAAGAARAGGVPYGFDAEDFHDAETEEAQADPVEAAIRRLLQSRLLPGCRLFTAGSPLIAREYARVYGREAIPLLNVFPLDEAPPAPLEPDPPGPDRPARAYWFSQTIGPGRGLEAAAAAFARMDTPVEMLLRGFPAAGYAERLAAAAATAGYGRPIRFLPPAASAEMARLSAPHDLGLCVEESTPRNHDLCLANKIFVYLLAGIPQLLSPTAAHLDFAPELGEAAIVADRRDPTETARRLDALLRDPARRASARSRAWELARSRYCWDVEKEKFLSAVAEIVDPVA